MNGGAHSRRSVRRAGRADLRAALSACRARDVAFRCTACGLVTEQETLARSLLLGGTQLARVTGTRLSRLQRQHLALALGWALLA